MMKTAVKAVLIYMFFIFDKEKGASSGSFQRSISVSISIMVSTGMPPSKL
jgi:hypothetical protein